MNDGLYKVTFKTPNGSAQGVAVIQGGRMLGGDSTHYYDGGFDLNGDKFHASLRVRRHTSGSVSLMGTDNAVFEVTGSLNDGHGHFQSVHGTLLEGTLSRLTD